MRTLVTGVNGFVGRHLTRVLLDAGHTVSGLSLQGEPVPGLAAMFEADMRDRDAVRSAVQDAAPDALVHLAGLAAPAASFGDPQGYLLANAGTQFTLLDAVRDFVPHCRVLVVSSGEIYGPLTEGTAGHSELAPLRPQNPYAVSKATQDLIGQQYAATFGLPVVLARPFNHIGPGQSDAFVASAFARQIAEAEAGLREPVIEVGRLDSQRDFTDVRDVTQAYRLLLEQGRPGQAYNIGSGQARSIESLLAGLLGHASVPLEVRQEPARLHQADAPVSLCDPSLLMQETGWWPAYDFDTSLRDVLDDWRARIRQSVTARP